MSHLGLRNGGLHRVSQKNYFRGMQVLNYPHQCHHYHYHPHPHNHCPGQMRPWHSQLTHAATRVCQMTSRWIKKIITCHNFIRYPRETNIILFIMLSFNKQACFQTTFRPFLSKLASLSMLFILQLARTANNAGQLENK